MSRTDESRPSLAEVLRQAVRAELLEVHTLLPARVERFEPEHQRCDVKPLLRRTVRRADGLLEDLDLPVITQCPIEYPAGGGWRITWPLAVGDIVAISFGERSLDEFLASTGAEPVTPEGRRRHDLTDAVVRAGLRPFTGAIPGIGTTDLVIGRVPVGEEPAATEIRLKPDGTIHLGTSPTVGVARLEDETQVTAETDAAMVQWMAAVHGILSTGLTGIIGGAAVQTAFIAAFGGTAPSTVKGKITTASDAVKAV